MKTAKKAARKVRQEEHVASRKLLQAAERDSRHAATILVIDAATVVAERPGQTVPQLSAALDTLELVGVGGGGWNSLVRHMPSYGLPLQEAIARMGACLARMRRRIATQAMSAVEPLLARHGAEPTCARPLSSRTSARRFRCCSSSGMTVGCAGSQPAA